MEPVQRAVGLGGTGGFDERGCPRTVSAEECDLNRMLVHGGKPWIKLDHSAEDPLTLGLPVLQRCGLAQVVVVLTEKLQYFRILRIPKYALAKGV